MRRLAFLAALLLALAACGGGDSIADVVSDAHEGIEVTCEESGEVAYQGSVETLYVCQAPSIETAGGSPAVLGCYLLVDGEAVNARDLLGDRVSAPGRPGIDCG